MVRLWCRSAGSSGIGPKAHPDGIDVDYDNKAVPRRFDVDISFGGELDEQLARLAKVAAACPLQRSIEAGFELHERLTAGDQLPSAGPAIRQRVSNDGGCTCAAHAWSVAATSAMARMIVARRRGRRTLP